VFYGFLFLEIEDKRYLMEDLEKVGRLIEYPPFGSMVYA
jgi:hypothetical protein